KGASIFQRVTWRSKGLSTQQIWLQCQQQRLLSKRSKPYSFHQSQHRSKERSAQSLKTSQDTSPSSSSAVPSSKVYRQDCETFGMVVKMLIEKDPSLEQSIQFALRQNLHEIGERCVEELKHFIAEYDNSAQDFGESF
ncbi:periphilin-1-like, partial [Perognathus longimembris pacificus]|uniref:periphilin-1-like n=1 Tax=Perognathus longimembris pacificus TaxID=214514 RepID=UPI0020193899